MTATNRRLTLPAQACADRINETTTNLAQITNFPDGAPRGLSGETALQALRVQADLAIAAGLLAIADALATRPQGDAR